MRDLVNAGLVIPLIVVAILAGICGFVIARQIAPPPKSTVTRVSVVALPATPVPTVSPTPVPPAEDSGGGGGGGSSGGASNCPSGCQCSGQPGGIVIICH